MPVVGPHTEYHYLSEAIPSGPWAVTAFDSGSDTQTAWRSVRLDDGSGCTSSNVSLEREALASDGRCGRSNVEGLFGCREDSY